MATDNRLELMRVAYHLGNRHTPVQTTTNALQLEADPVLEDMLVRLGITVAHGEAPITRVTMATCTDPTVVITITIITMTNAAQLTALLHLASPALPVGTFSYSHGLEAAVDVRHVADEASAACGAPLCLPQLADWRAGRFDAVAERDGWFPATCEMRELRLEASRMGWSLKRLSSR